MRWSPSSNVTPTATSDSDSPPRVTHPSNFSRLSATILTFSSSGVKLPPTSHLRHWSSRTSDAKNRYSRTNTTTPTFFPPFYHYFNLSRSVGDLPPTSPLQQHRIPIPLLALLLLDFVPSFYHHFNVSWCGGALPPTEPLHQHQIRIPLLALPTPRFCPIFLPPF